MVTVFVHSGQKELRKEDVSQWLAWSFLQQIIIRSVPSLNFRDEALPIEAFKDVVWRASSLRLTDGVFPNASIEVQWCSMVWDKISMIWDIIDLTNHSLDWYDDLTKSDYHGNSNVADTKKVRFQPNLSENFETEVGSVKEKRKIEISLINQINGH